MSTAQKTVKPRKVKIKAPAVMELVICHTCGDISPKEETVELGGKYLCSECIDHETFICDKCDTRFWNDDNAGDYDTRLCQTCYDNHYTRCGDCGIVIRNDSVYYAEGSENEVYCYYCYVAPQNGAAIHNYSYKPAPVFYGLDGSGRYFGVELEVDDGGRDSDNAHHLLQVANRVTETIYIKNDGSLNNGFEIVTHPMTLDYHTNDMAWKPLTQKALRIGYKSHKTSTCGMHVHVNRTAFTEDATHQDLCISRILFIIERFWEELFRFSRRTKTQINSYSRRFGFRHEPAEILNTAKSSNFDRHTCLNLNNQHTIEFRIFKGTLKHNTIIATLQLVNYICDMAVSMTTDNVTGLSWADFVERIDSSRYPELITYLKERRLYINEEITVEEEDS